MMLWRREVPCRCADNGARRSCRRNLLLLSLLYSVGNTSTRSQERVAVATTMTPEISTTTRFSRAPLTLRKEPSRPSYGPPWMRTFVPLATLISSGLKYMMPSFCAPATIMKLSICWSGTTTICFFPSAVGM